MIRKSVLSNGVRVLTEAMPQVLSSTIGVWVENGSRYETGDENGVSHFIEHLLFKGTESRSAAEIAEQMDAVGGVLNAFTGKEYTCYYAKVLGDDLAMAADLLSDLFLHSTFAPEEIDRERQVVLQEISQAEDTPDDFIHELFNMNYWSGHPLAMPITGTAGTVRGIDRSLLTTFMADRYGAERVFIAAAGMVDHDRLVAQCESLFGAIAGNGAKELTAPPTDRPILIGHQKDLEQAHLCIGGAGIGRTDRLRSAAYILNTALGGGMSSRLFQEVREKRGRVYTIYSFMSSYLDCGYFGIYAGTSPEWVDEVIEVTLGELKKVVSEGLTPGELSRAKSQIKGNMVLGLESTDSRMQRLATNEIYFRRDVAVEEVFAGIDAVTNDQIIELAARCFRPEAMGLVLLGDLKGRELTPKLWSPLH